MESAEQDGNGARVPISRGGPLFVPNLVGPLASVPEFKASIVRELQALQAALSAVGDFDDELSVDELRVFTEEELVEKALEALEETEDGEGNSSPTLRGGFHAVVSTASTSSDKQIVPLTSSSIGGNSLDSRMLSNGSSIEPHGSDHSEENGQHISKNRKKRGRRFDRDTRASELDSINFEEVERFVKIKQNQDEDRAAARLHSFHESSKPAAGAHSTSERIGRLQSLKFITSTLKVKQSKEGIFISQAKYTIELMKKYGFDKAKPISTPMATSTKLDSDEKGKEAKSLNECQHIPVRYPEVVLCVEVYGNRLTGQKNQELFVLGTQRLTALRDSIYCSTNQLMQAAEQYDPSGYFLIEDLFLNDMRDPLAIDYSKPILEWLISCKKEAKEKWECIVSGEIKKHRQLLGNLTSTDLPQFKAIDMHKIRLCDLCFRLGSGYLYCHQGNCKHIIVIRDMRLIHPEDDQNEAAYPVVTFQLRSRRQKCSVCKIKLSVLMTVDDKWAAKNPCYFCKDCYYLLHYKEDNSLLYDDFSVYDLESCWPMSRRMDKFQHMAPNS